MNHSHCGLATMRALSQLDLNQRAVVHAISTDVDLLPRLSALGLREHSEVTVIRRGWLGGPLHLRVGNTEFMLRRADAALIQVLPIASTVVVLNQAEVLV
ncbi:FeoA family protein [uncultured Deefgea sp.]|uniref:FeoA family protein n=1 Tax=uncultured Deefgea sp. TaxID=1304914 RepID=UPI002593ECE6|nr:FeoA family protein [uncultured Deefgea sp.]